MFSKEQYGNQEELGPTDPNLAETVVRRCSVKKVFLKSSQNLQEKTRVRRPATLLTRDFSKGVLF